MDADAFCICKTSSTSLVVPLFIVNAPADVFVTISGVDELSYACCNVVVDIPPAAPISSPNLDANKNLACVEFDKSVALETTDKTPISIPLLEKFEKIVKFSVCTFDIAVAKSTYKV